MLSSLLPILLLLLASVMVTTRMKDSEFVGRITGTQPEEEVGVGQIMTLDQPVSVQSPCLVPMTHIRQSLCVTNMTNFAMLHCTYHVVLP